MSKLTIAIPSYNRNVSLNESLAVLLPQLTPEHRVVILDNHSPTPIQETVGEVLAKFPQAQVEIVRHRWNLGATANILRCLELCESDWVWILGDDDLVSTRAIEQITATIEKYPNAKYLSFITEEIRRRGLRPNVRVAQGRAEFIDQLDFAHLINFMSCSVWRADFFRPQIGSAYDYAYSMGWAFVLLLTSLAKGGEVVFSPEALVDSATISPQQTRWSYRKFILGWATLLELPLTHPERASLAPRLLGLHSPENVTVYLLADQVTHRWPDRFLYFDLARSRLVAHHVHFASWLRFTLYRMLFWFPDFGWFIVRSAVRLANRLGLKSIDIADLENRSAL